MSNLGNILLVPARTESVLRASDTFTDADATSILTHVPEIGTWVKYAASTNTADPTIIGNRIVGENAATVSIYSCVSPQTPNYIVSCDVVMRSDNNLSQNGPIGRLVTGVVTYYHARYNTLTNAWQLYKFVNSTPTQLGTDQAAVLTVDQAYRCDLWMTGSLISMVVDGVTLVSVTDTAIPNAGRAGFRIGGAETGTTGVHLDNFSVRTL